MINEKKPKKKAFTAALIVALLVASAIIVALLFRDGADEAIVEDESTDTQQTITVEKLESSHTLTGESIILPRLIKKRENGLGWSFKRRITRP